MLFLFYLLTVCLAVPIEKVNQVLDTKDAPPFGNDLLTKLKSSKDDELSKLLITSLADADPDAVRHVKSLVEALIAAGEGERDTYTQDRDAKQTAFDTASGQLDADTTAHTTVAGQLSNARDEVTRLEGLKSDGQTAKDEAQDAYDNAVTSLGEAQGWLDDETTRVDSEKETLEEIRRLLNTVLPAETSGWVEIAHVGADDSNTMEDFWSTICGAFGDLDVEDIVLMHIGEVKDYFKPTSPMSMCHFLDAHDYTWSDAEDGIYRSYVPHDRWFEPYSLGGSDIRNLLSDGRQTPSRWGLKGNHPNLNHYTGGCCYEHSLIYGGFVEDTPTWYHPFTLYVKKK